jgi:hypothetical protein
LFVPASRGIPVAGCDISQIESRECAAGIVCYILLLLTPLSSGAGFIYKNLEVHLAGFRASFYTIKKHFDSYDYYNSRTLIGISTYSLSLFNAVLGKPFSSPNRRLLLLFLHGTV